MLTGWWQNASCVRYIKGSLRLGLTFQPFVLSLLNILVDSNQVGDMDDQKSTISSCIFFGPNLVSWVLKK